MNEKVIGQHNEEIAKIRQEISNVREKYSRNALEIVSDHNRENATRNDYKQRQISELLQNADDCFLNDEERNIHVKFLIRGDFFIALNDGRPFDSRGIASLMHADASSKYFNTIGCKGLGFRSVLNWSTDILICTQDFNVRFSESQAKELFKEYREKSDGPYSADLSRIQRTAILTSAEVDNDQETKAQYLEEGYVTAVVLRCDQNILDAIEEQLRSIKFEELLFLKHIAEIGIQTPNIQRHIRVIPSDPFRIEDNDKTSSWHVWRKEGALAQSDGNQKHYELAIAYNEDPEVREFLKKEGCLYSFFKTEVPMRMPFLVHGTFELTSERNGLEKDNDNNRRLLSILTDFIVEIGEEIAHKRKSADYAALMFVLPPTNAYFNGGYDFYGELKSKIKGCRLFPSICGEYLSLEDNPRYSSKRFDKVLNKEDFRTLLIHCEDPRVEPFLSECRISFYRSGEFCNLINPRAEEYIRSGANVEIIRLYNKEYGPDAPIAPYLLVDSEGNHATDQFLKIFNNPTEAFSLPTWSKMRFIDAKLWGRLAEALGMSRASDLAKALAPFNVEEYAFDKVVASLNRQCVTLEQVLNLLQWLYDTWRKQNQSFPSALGKTDVRVLTRDGAVAPASSCYFGSEYGRAVEERIASAAEEKPLFLASQATLRINGDRETFIRFMETLGAKRFPEIKPIELLYAEQKSYLRYNEETVPVLSSDRGTINSQEFREKYNGISITVDSVEHLQNIFQQCAFEDIVYWILNDKNLADHIYAECEISGFSHMKGKKPYAQGYSQIVLSSMRSYLRKVFTKTSWINTESGKKVTCDKASFTKYNLSPILETIHIDYEKILALHGGKSRSEIDSVFERLGVAYSLADLPKETVYDILWKLPELDRKDFSLGKRVYAELNDQFDAEGAKRLTEGNEKYDLFCKKGKVLAKRYGRLSYLPCDEVYYLEDKIFNNELLDKYPLLALGKRSGKKKVFTLFRAKAIDEKLKIRIGGEKLHELDAAFQDYYQHLIPYIYAKRINKDNKGSDLRDLRSTRISLVEDALVYCGEEVSRLSYYDLILTEKKAVIRVPEDILSLMDLRRNPDFQNALADFFTTLFKVGADRDSYMLMISREDFSALEKDFRNNDDYSTALKRSISLFRQSVDPKNNFFSAIAQCRKESLEETKRQYEDDLGEDFDYQNIDISRIIPLFKKLGIDIEDYNVHSNASLSIQSYFQERFHHLIDDYREAYSLFIAKKILSSGGSFDQYQDKRREYNCAELPDIPNSVNVDIEAVFANLFGVTIEELKQESGDIDALVKSLPEPEPVVVEPANNAAPSSPVESAPAEEEDYAGLFKSMSAEDPLHAEEMDIQAPEAKVGNGKGKGGSGGSYDTSNNKRKEWNGFIAESAVYLALLRRLGDETRINWVSGNAEKANKQKSGNDSLGYDICYNDGDQNHYVEVKGTSGSAPEFSLSKNEVEFGQSHKEHYELWLVFIADGRPKQIITLGNIFLLEQSETFFHNSRFSVENESYKIRVKLKEETKQEP